MKEFKLVKKEENREITGLIIEPKKGMERYSNYCSWYGGK